MTGPPAPHVRVRVCFVGRVQGVGFRATATSIAARHPVTGWVRNEPDGSVVLEAQGSEPATDALLQQILTAMGSKVRTHTLASIPVQTGETSFETRR